MARALSPAKATPAPAPVATPEIEISSIPVAQVEANPDQPRKLFDPSDTAYYADGLDLIFKAVSKARAAVGKAHAIHQATMLVGGQS
jgi:hypothetical protein